MNNIVSRAIEQAKYSLSKEGKEEIVFLFTESKINDLYEAVQREQIEKDAKICEYLVPEQSTICSAFAEAIRNQKTGEPS